MLKNWIVGVVVVLTAGISFAKEEVPANVIAGKQVEANAKLTVGTKLVGIWDKKNYLVEVIEIKKGDEIRIHWIGFEKSDDVDVAPSTLYYIADTSTTTRKSRTSPLPKDYQPFDKNGDGQIGLYEWDRARYAEFKKLDKNRDGFLTPQELNVKAVVPVAVAGATTGTPATTGVTTETKEPLPNPGTLEAYNEMIEKTFTFSVTGKAGGNVIGAGIYSNQSDLAAAAVHAGVLKEGVTGNVTVTIVAAPAEFKGTMANGVTSRDGATFAAAYTIK